MLLQASRPPKVVIDCLHSIGLMLTAGTRLPEAVAFAHAQTTNSTTQTALATIHETLLKGKSLSFALEEYPELFPPSLMSAVYAGEESGCLAEVLLRLASFYREDQQAAGKLTGTLVYPMVVTVVTSSVFAFLLAFVLPKIIKIHEVHGAVLPLATQLLIEASMLVRSAPCVAAAAMAFIAGGWLLFSRRGQRLLEGALLALPVTGPLMRSYLVSRFCSFFSIFLSGGLTVPESLNLLERMGNGTKLGRSLQVAHARVTSGNSLILSLKETQLFPEDVLRLVHTGLETDRLVPLLEEASRMHREVVTNGTTAMVGFVEPLATLVLGGGIAFFVIALYLPLLKLTTSVVGSF